MREVVSRDGTRLAVERLGHGPALILVGGSLADHHFYSPLANELAPDFTVYNFDRRGRGRSGDSGPFAVEREVEDVDALIAEAGGSAHLYGHSAGSALALRAAAAGLDIAKLALADPPYTPHGDADEEAVAAFTTEAAHVQQLHDRGDHRGSAAFFLSSLGLSPEDVAGMLDSPAGARMIDCARALPYDYAMLGDGLVPTSLAAKVQAPTVVLAPEVMQPAAQALAEAVPHGRYEPIAAPVPQLAPEQLARVLARFFGEP